MSLSHITRIAFGRARPDGGSVTDRDWTDFRDNRVAKAFPDGFTIIHAEGGWRDAATGQTIEEPSIILEVAHSGDEEAMRAIRAIATSYKIIFGQDAVMATTVPATVEFI